MECCVCVIICIVMFVSWKMIRCPKVNHSTFSKYWPEFSFYWSMAMEDDIELWEGSSGSEEELDLGHG